MNRSNIRKAFLLAGITGAAILLILFVVNQVGSDNSTELDVFIDDVAVSGQASIKVYHQADPQKGLVVYIGDKKLGGLNAQYARQLAALSYYVAVIDGDAFHRTLKSEGECINLVQQLGRVIAPVQSHYAINSLGLPILVGNGSGATLVYAALAQQERASFYAGISINFLPALPEMHPLCSLGSLQFAGSELRPAKHLHASWYVFQDSTSANNSAAEVFIESVINSKLTVTADVPHIPNNEVLQVLQWLDPRLPDQLASSSNDSDLPIIEVEAEANNKDIVAVLLTGDGGWAEIDKSLAARLAEHGIPTVALDSLSYFWHKRTPDETAAAVDELIGSYGAKWNKQRVLLVGFSYGAEVMPFIANRLSHENKAKVTLVALLSLGKTASFEFRLSNWIGSDQSIDRLEVLPELAKMSWVDSVCIYGKEDESSACSRADGARIKLISMDGDHHFDGNHELLAQHILSGLKF